MAGMAGSIDTEHKRKKQSRRDEARAAEEHRRYERLMQERPKPGTGGLLPWERGRDVAKWVEHDGDKQNG